MSIHSHMGSDVWPLLYICVSLMDVMDITWSCCSSLALLSHWACISSNCWSCFCCCCSLSAFCLLSSCWENCREETFLINFRDNSLKCLIHGGLSAGTHSHENINKKLPSLGREVVNVSVHQSICNKNVKNNIFYSNTPSKTHRLSLTGSRT